MDVPGTEFLVNGFRLKKSYTGQITSTECLYTIPKMNCKPYYWIKTEFDFPLLSLLDMQYKTEMKRQTIHLPVGMYGLSTSGTLMPVSVW